MFKFASRHFEKLMTHEVQVLENKIVRVGNISKSVPVATIKSKCRLSFNDSSIKDMGLTSSSEVYAVLFVPSDIVIKEGAKAVVSQLGVKYDIVIGKLKVYSTHNEYEVREFIKRV